MLLVGSGGSLAVLSPERVGPVVEVALHGRALPRGDVVVKDHVDLLERALELGSANVPQGSWSALYSPLMSLGR